VTYNFNLTKDVDLDLNEIQDYIARDNPTAAANTIDKIISACNLLNTNPLSGHLRDDITSKKVRFWRVKSYLIIYSTETKPITIVRVLNGSRDIVNLL